MSIDEKRIREFAYQIWESEGRPHGQESRHWEMARTLVEAEKKGGRKPLAEKPRRVTKPKAVADAVKPKAVAGDGAAKPKPKTVASEGAAKPKPAPAKKPKAPADSAVKPASPSKPTASKPKKPKV